MTNKEFCLCIEQLQNNDMSALSALYEEYFQKIKFYALSFTKDTQSAYDIAMNVMVKMVDFDGDPNQIKNHVAYLMAIAKNESLNFIKHNLRNTFGYIKRRRTRGVCITLYLGDKFKGHSKAKAKIISYNNKNIYFNKK